MVDSYAQWQMPPEDVDTKINLNYVQLPNQQTETTYDIPTMSQSSIQAAYGTSQPPPIPMQRHDYPVPLESHPQMNFYPQDSTSSSWSNERNSGRGQYWQHGH